MTPWPTNELRYLIADLLNGRLDYRSFKRFYDYCHAIAVSYLRNKHFGGSMYLDIRSNVSRDIADLATDCIAPLFEQDERLSFPQIQFYFRDTIKSAWDIVEPELFLLLKTLIVSRINQELILIFKDADPVGFRILRNINLAVKYSSKLELTEWDDSFYLHLKRKDARFPDDYFPQKDAIYYDDLVHLSARHASLQSNFPKLLITILEEIEAEGQYATMIERCHLNHCMRRALNFHQKDLDMEQISGAMSSSLSYNKYKPILESLLNELQPVILRLHKKKNGSAQFLENLYQEIVSKYFSDLLQDGYPEYLPEYWRDMATNNEDYQVHKASLEYLIRLGKEKLKKMQKFF